LHWASHQVCGELGALQGGRILDNQSAPLTIDFLPGEDIRGQRIRVVTEETIVAMFSARYRQ
jgi:hypothetical protein